MRIIAGRVGGLGLRVPAGRTIRPTSDRARETLFNVLAPGLEGAVVLDLFAGTGAMGIEALSRGARRAVFVERDRRALEALRANIERARMSEEACVMGLDWCAAVRRLSVEGPCFDLIIADPPWSERLGSTCLRELAARSRVDRATRVVIEHRATDALDIPAGWQVDRELRIGDTAFALCRRMAPEAGPLPARGVPEPDPC